jgi:hypothetical protein
MAFCIWHRIRGNIRDFLLTLPYCLWQRVDTPRINLIRRVATPPIVYSGEFQMYEFCTENLACHLTQGVDTSRLV